jgi:pyrrolidone-carboxylate peptidase
MSRGAENARQFAGWLVDKWSHTRAMADRARQKLLLTGFGAFGPITDNPSGRILPALEAALRDAHGDSTTITARRLEVHFGAIDACSPETYDMVVSLGVDAKASSIRLETHAANHFVDLEGNTRAIDEAQLAPLITGKALPALPRHAGDWAVTEGTAGSAGTFVCNQTYYALCRTAGPDGYFIHIPNIQPVHDSALVRALADIIGELMTAPRP